MRMGQVSNLNKKIESKMRKVRTRNIKINVFLNEDEKFYEVLSQLRGMANNLNQMARTYNRYQDYMREYKFRSSISSTSKERNFIWQQQNYGNLKVD